MTNQPWPPPSEVLPHRDSLLLLCTILQSDDSQLEALARIPAETLLGKDLTPTAPSILAVEMAAQAAAYHALVGARESDEPQATKGYLVRLREVDLGSPHLASGAETLVRVKRVGGVASLGIYEFCCKDGERAVAKGQLSILKGD